MPPPHVMDALEILGLQAAGENDGLLPTAAGEDEEIIACNNIGSDADRTFDSIIGVIEGIMVSPALSDALAHAVDDCPPFTSLDEHQRFLEYKRFLGRIETLVDDAVASALPHLTLERIAALVKEREAEVSDEVIELVEGACLSYSAFAALWEKRDNPTHQ